MSLQSDDGVNVGYLIYSTIHIALKVKGPLRQAAKKEFVASNHFLCLHL